MPSSGSVVRNATLAIAQVLFSGIVLFLLYRFLLSTLGAERVGIWSLVLATASASRISELGLTGGAIKFVASANAKGDFRRSAAIIQTAALTIACSLALVLFFLSPALVSLIGRLIPAARLDEALELLPYALASIWLAGLSGVVLGSLDGCQRVDLRAMVIMGSGVIFLILVWLLIPRYGLVALGVAQVLQSLVMLVAGWVLLRRQVPALPILPFAWEFGAFRELFGYGLGFQVISVFTMLYEPATKALLSAYGGLTAVAYYEMATRMVLQLRGLVVAANQVLVPKIAALHATEPTRLNQAYQRSYDLVFYIAIPLYLSLLAAVPLIGRLWIGHRVSDFEYFTVAIAIGYLVNTLGAPAYFMNLGTGDLRWNVVAHVLLGILTVSVGFPLGLTFGGYGVVTASVLALIIASSVIVWGYHRDTPAAPRVLIPATSRALLAVSLLGAVTCWLIPRFVPGGWPGMVTELAPLCFAGAAVALALWRHPQRELLVEYAAREIRRARKYGAANHLDTH